MPQENLIIRGAREHNLKNIDLTIPRDKLVVFTGLSGSGKSSLAFDTIFAEGQRRYVESLSAYARQFLGQMDKPDVDYIQGLSPAISIDQKSTSRNPRSTVGTVTEIHDYLRLLYARVGHPHCPRCGREIAQQSVEQIVDTVLGFPPGKRVMILAPVVRGRKGESRNIFEDARQNGYVRVRVDGRVYDLSDEIALDKNKKHDIEVVVDRLVIHDRHSADEEAREDAARLADSVETALKLGEGLVLVAEIDGPEHLFSEHFACVYCGISVGEIEPRTFSFNNPHGACPACTGLGARLEFDPDLVIPNPNLSLADGAIQPWARSTTTYYTSLVRTFSAQHGIDIRRPWKDLSEQQQKLILYGSSDGAKVRLTHSTKSGRVYEFDGRFDGVIPMLTRRYKESESESFREECEGYMSSVPCPECKGARLKPEALAVTVGGRNIVEVSRLSIYDASLWFTTLAGADGEAEAGMPGAHEAIRSRTQNGKHAGRGPDLAPAPLTMREMAIARQILKEIRARLGFLVNVGLGYLSLERSATTLSGGEAQRIRLASQIGSGLMGVLYVLDEPSIGLHQRDNGRLLNTLIALRDMGNTLIVVEHDEDTMRAADFIVDIGPAAGEHGGHVVAAGTIDEVIACRESLTGQYLAGHRFIPVPRRRRRGSGKNLTIRGARENNLRDVTARFPLGTFTCVTGVSGSGKSTLVNEVLYKAVAQHVYRMRRRAGLHHSVEGLDQLDKVIDIDQSPIGRTPRSNPATYTGLFTPIRELFAQVPESRIRGYLPGRFSFNVKGGRCEACAGEGIIKIEMHFLPDVYVPCEVCKGKRYNREALEIRYKGKTISDVLEMTVSEALEFFSAVPSIHNKLKTLDEVGLGYIRLGQPATQLSGGEAQRVKLATELSKRATGRTLYILDEPTTGLHFADVARLLQVLNRLVDSGNTVVVIEHNLEVIKTADWLIDLGPEGGDDGGTIVAEGTPEDLARHPGSFTGQYLARIMAGETQAAVGW
jgi:excinuclease ABC subunit A